MDVHLKSSRPTTDSPIDAGVFSLWLSSIRDVFKDKCDALVSCGTCTACCASSQFIHIFAHETDAISRIPEKLLYPAPLLPQGTLLLGYDEKGRCPLLRRARCSIYDHRPLTCRSYDCRIFTAAGLSPDRDEKGLISARVRAWRFRYPTKRDRDLQAAVKAAAKFIESHSECFPEEKRSHSSAQTAVLAVRAYEVFLDKKITSAHNGRAAQDSATTTAIINILNK